MYLKMIEIRSTPLENQNDFSANFDEKLFRQKWTGIRLDILAYQRSRADFISIFVYYHNRGRVSCSICNKIPKVINMQDDLYL